MRISFNPSYSIVTDILMETLPNLALVMEIFFKFFTAIYINGEIITDRKMIAKNYIKKRF